MVVSICCLTYNHSPYIGQCIEGFLMQKCNFNFEVLIHDDASTDGTSEIIQKYQEKFPKIIKPIVQTENQWSNGKRLNIRFNFPRAQGKYIALCEGDDYWTDPLKLQRQVDFMEENEDYAVVGHNRHILKEGQLTESISKTWVFTQCMLFRKECLSNDFFEYIRGVYNGDTFLYYYLCMKGKPEVLDFFGAVYRITTTGVYTSIKDDSEKFIKALSTYKQLYQLSKVTSYRYSKKVHKEVKKQLTSTLFLLVEAFKKKKDYFKVIRFSFLLVRYGDIKDIKKLLILYLK